MPPKAVNLLLLAKHLLSFAAPALAVAVLVTLAARLVLPPPRGAARRRWWVPLGLLFLVGLGVLAAGLWVFGRDGKMASYAALVLVLATLQWVVGRGWRS